MSKLDELFILSADSPSGLRWRVDRDNGRGRSMVLAGGVAGSLSGKGLCYFRVFFDGRSVGVHRVIFCMANGYELADIAGSLVDHADSDTRNNAPENLRLASRSQNQWNRRANAGTRFGLKGVRLDPKTGRFQAQISVNKKRTSIGYFDTAEAAAEAYQQAARRLHGEFFRPQGRA